jgi:tetratricopeptide (TPR) repeat protein
MVQVQMAGIHLTLNRPGAAESVLRDCLVRFPQSVAARQYLLDVLGLQLREREMMAVLDELWQLAATRPVMDKVWILSKSLHVRFMRPNEEEVWPTLQAFARQEPDNLHTQVATAKLRLLMNADVLEAARTLEHCLERSPDNLEAIAALATHYVQHEAVAAERIEELLDRWRSVSQDAEYWQALGDWQVRTGDLDDALDSYRRARTHNPSQWHTPHKIGLLLIRLAKQSAETDPALIAEGQRLLDEAAALKEMRASASKHFEFLQKWLRDSAETSRIVSAPLPLPELAEIATFCESVQSYTDALRWCDLIQRADPSETTSATIRQRVTVQMEAARGPG